MATFKHFILTRWNLLLDGQSVYTNSPDPDGWMRHRAELFERITLPSIKAQRLKNFTWLLAFDRQTPKEYYLKYLKHPYIEVIYDYPKTYMNNLFKERKIKNGDWLITTRLDNDDFLEHDFVFQVQRQFNDYRKIVDTDGVQWDLESNKFYTVERRFNNSPFLSLIERAGDMTPLLSGVRPEEPIKTCFYCSHTKMIDHFPSMKIDKKLYRMVIHDRNISNRIVGKEIIYKDSK